MIQEMVLGAGVGWGVENEFPLKDKDSKKGEEVKIDISSATVSSYMYS